MYDMILRSWHTLNEILVTLREDQVKELLDHELQNKRRPDVAERLHQRLTKLRTTRERLEIKEKLGCANKETSTPT